MVVMVTQLCESFTKVVNYLHEDTEKSKKVLC